MEHVTQNTNPSTPRDYDKDPIVIEDINPLFGWWETLYILFPVALILVLLDPFEVNKHTMLSKMLIMLPIAALPIYRKYKLAKGHRKIILKKDEMDYYHDEYRITHINLNSIKSIHKTFDDFYHSSQTLNEFYKFLLVVFFPFVIVGKLALLCIKIYRQIIDGIKLSDCQLHDAIIIENNSGEVITILPTNKDESQQIRQFFKSIKNIDIDQLPTRYSVFYSFEKINIGEK